MKIRKPILDHLEITWTGFKQWLRVQTMDAILVGLLWFAGLYGIGVPLAPFWALLGMLLQFVPIWGTILALVGPACGAAITGGWMQMAYVCILYAAIVSIDGMLLQPLLMKRSAKVPVWISITAPLLLGSIFNIWGVILAPPLLAVIYTYRQKRLQEKSATESGKPTDPE